MSQKSADTAQRIDEVVRLSLSPRHLEVIDDSHKHAGHAGAREGGGHFTLVIVSEAFAGQSLLARHRTVNALLAEELKSRIHALALKTLTPEEWAQRA